MSRQVGGPGKSLVARSEGSELLSPQGCVTGVRRLLVTDTGWEMGGWPACQPRTRGLFLRRQQGTSKQGQTISGVQNVHLSPPSPPCLVSPDRHGGTPG